MGYLGWSLLGSFLIIALGWIIVRGGSDRVRGDMSRYNDIDHDALIDESQLEGDLRRDLQDISFGGRS